MLVLTRKHGEKILIGDDIVITVLETRRDGVRIGIDAPHGVKIQRDEVLRAVTEANVAATEVDPDAENRIKALLGLISSVEGPASPVTRSASSRPTDSAASDS